MPIRSLRDVPEADPSSSCAERADRAPTGSAAVARVSDHATRLRPPVRKRTLRIEIAPSTIVTVVAIALATALLTQLVPVILVLITGLMLVGTLSPAVEWLERHKVNRLSAIAIVFIALLVVVAALAVFTVPAFVIQVGSLVEQEPALRATLVKFLASYPLTTSLAETLRHLQYGQLFKSYSTACRPCPSMCCPTRRPRLLPRTGIRACSGARLRISRWNRSRCIHRSPNGY